MSRLACCVLVVLAPVTVRAQLLSPVWVELGEDGAMLARVVVLSSRDCPSLSIDGASRGMEARSPAPRGFRPVCEAMIPAGARLATVNGRALPLAKADPSRVAVFGDTGCRINRNEVQDCNDPAHWPFLRLAGRVSSTQPDVVIHVGDFLYREIPCPEGRQASCAGTPAGDNWETWNADFFTPAAPLLATTPWVFTRGNHESCDRSWRGWFYYLDPHPWRGEVCEPMQPPYRVALGSFRLIVFDSSAAGDSLNNAQVAAFASALASLHEDHAWLASHHPFWGLRTSDNVSQTAAPSLTKAWRKADPQGIDLIVSGHVHLFELLGFDHGLPPQVVAGDGGTNLAIPLNSSLRGMRLDYATIQAGVTERQFGFTLLTRDAKVWNVTLNNLEDRASVNCSIARHVVSCRH